MYVNRMEKKTVDGGSKKGSSSFHDLVSAFQLKGDFFQQFRFTFCNRILTSPTVVQHSMLM